MEGRDRGKGVGQIEGANERGAQSPNGIGAIVGAG